jgi:hypothetical protein
MRIIFSIGEGVMQPVEDSIRIGTQIRRTLTDEGANVKHFFPKPRHGKHAVGGVTMVEKRLEKE